MYISGSATICYKSSTLGDMKGDVGNARHSHQLRLERERERIKKEKEIFNICGRPTVVYERCGWSVAHGENKTRVLPNLCLLMLETTKEREILLSSSEVKYDL